jgi:S1-C subfamily serine protease
MDATRAGSVRLSSLLLLLAALGGAWWLGAHSRLARSLVAAEPRAVTPRGDLAADEQATIELFKSASDSVAYIQTLESVRIPYQGTVQQMSGTGSGFVWDKAGHVVTNFHVVQGASGALVTLHDGSQYEARHLVSYADKDLAVLTIDAPPDKLFPVTLGSSHDLQVGQKAFAIGNPYGLDYSLSHGIISALDREMNGVGGRRISGVIQTDAAVNPGNSGGPLLDSAGRLIGINTMIFTESGSSAGLSFAVPADEVNRVVTQLIAKGRVTRPGLGFEYGKASEARFFGVTGVPVKEVLAGSSAHKAGLRGYRVQGNRLRLGDVVVAVDGRRVADSDDLIDALERLEVGQVVKVTVLREGRELEVDIPLQALE